VDTISFFLSQCSYEHTGLNNNYDIYSACSGRPILDIFTEPKAKKWKIKSGIFLQVKVLSTG